jgi:DNA-binding beta-propeller fold protein YncE
MKLARWGVCGATASVLVLAGIALAGAPKGGYHLLKKYSIGGGDGKTEYWDYITLDESTRRLYLSHGTEVKVVSADTGEVVGTIRGFQRDHGIALVKELNKGFVTDGNAAQVVVFDLTTLKVTGQIKVGEDADCIIYDPSSKHVFVMNGGTKDAMAIDPVSEKVVGTVPMGGRPEYAVADGKGMIYDNIQDKNEVAVLNTHSLTITARWPIAPAERAASLTMDREHRRLFIGGRNKIFAVMNADTGKIIQTFPIGDGVDANVYEPKTSLVFAATREGILHIFHEDTPDKFSLVENVETEPGARNMALDPKTHEVFLDSADLGQPPAPTAQQPNPNPPAIPGTFRLLVYGR